MRGLQVLELLLFVTFIGLVLASSPRLGSTNPFQLYFFTWFSTIVAYYFSSESYFSVSSDFWLLMFFAKSIALLILIGAYVDSSRQPRPKKSEWAPVPRGKLILAAQVVVLLSMPLAYQRAVYLAAGNDVFTIAGYVSLRYAMTQEGISFGYAAYFSILSFVVSSITIYLYFRGAVSFYRLFLSVSISMFYLYLGTGRTFVLLFAILMILPLVRIRIVRFKGIVASLLLLSVAFVFVAMMTDKGVSADVGFSENLRSFFDIVRSYVVAPLLSFAQLAKSPASSSDLGLNTFRTFFAIAYALELSNTAPVVLIRDYVFVPDPMNVYTVYDAYFRDFSTFGICIPPIFLVGHWLLYRKSERTGGVWLFYYSASTYPLIMQFFQDQYFSLLSTWIQIAFWYWLLLAPSSNYKLKPT